MNPIHEIDAVIEASLGALAADARIRQWNAKENNWVNYFAFRYLIRHCRPESVFRDPAQIGIEVGVPQKPQYAKEPTRAKESVRRDLVIWPEVGMTCWTRRPDGTWVSSCHPLAIVEWKVRRPGSKNPSNKHERNWLKSYCREQPSVVAYAILVDGSRTPTAITCARFLGDDELTTWREWPCQ